ncbi:DUF1700 domain-containing protein [Acidobacteria bacterium AB60]|nr:DUF1700 domain-containing protein [Acidobacteria bacterium AB60]
MNGTTDIQSWLRRLKWALDSMPSTERDDIIAETRTHIEERIAKGQSLEEAIDAFGPPDVYARRFLDEIEMSTALGSQRTGALLSVVIQRAHRNISAALSLVALGCLVLTSSIAVILVFLKITDPIHTGLWFGRERRIFFIGVIRDPGIAHDLLGNWLLPVAVLVLVLSWLLGRFVLLWSVRGLARNS